ncbi:PAS domain S-box protein [Flavobacteriaceae bacterium AU392]|nr:PAS domain S-box protein [Flavobacteriaceae bacterium]RKM85916.1 PAS domain S-box protein [Flavobacteriaceae bacterium AU392]
MSQDQIDILQRALHREKLARKQAEKILEEKSLALFNTAQELKEANHKLEFLLDEKTVQLQGVFENINDAYLVMDIKGNVIKMNDAAIELFGYNVENESINVTKLIYKEDYRYAIQSFKELVKKGFFTDYTARVFTKAKEVKWVHINASIIYNKQKEPVAAQGIIRDITEAKFSANLIEEQKEALEKSNDELQEYAHIVSHDLKSPLRSIDALVNWIKEDNKEKFDEVSLQNFELIESTLEKMEQLISDILNYSSLGNNNETEEVDLNVLVTDLKQILFVPEHISIDILNKLPIIRGDKTKLQQLFQNLMSNAIKFNDKKKGVIEIDVSEKKLFYQFSIKDNGIGIDKKYHSKIFKIFHALNDNKKSSGIGLSIVKKIVDLFNGRIWVDSKLGIETTFYFTLKKV